MHTQNQKQVKSSLVLRLARELIADGTCRYLCYAVNRAEASLYGTYLTSAISQNLHKLFPHRESVVEWLMDQSPEISEQIKKMDLFTRDRVMNKYRLCWIDWLIPQYIANGD